MFNGGKKYDVFISYRRGGGEWIARCLFYYLEKKGLDCFFDRRDVRSGHFDKILKENIAKYDYFFSVISEGTLPVRGDEDWFAKEWNWALELKTDDHIIPLVIGGPSYDDKTLDAFTGTVNRLSVDAGANFERDVNAVIERCDSLKQKVKNSEKSEAERVKDFRVRAEKTLRKKKLNRGIPPNDPRYITACKELLEIATEQGIKPQAEEIIEEIEYDWEKSLADIKKWRRWLATHPKIVCLIRRAVAIFVIWCVYKSAPFVYGMLPPERRAKVDEVAQEAVRGLGWLREKVSYICNGTVKELSRSLR